jgi:hypothetical protein
MEKTSGRPWCTGTTTGGTSGISRRQEAFVQFAPLYGRWSLLMHAEDDCGSLSEAAHA